MSGRLWNQARGISARLRNAECDGYIETCKRYMLYNDEFIIFNKELFHNVINEGISIIVRMNDKYGALELIQPGDDDYSATQRWINSCKGGYSDFHIWINPRSVYYNDVIDANKVLFS